MTLLISSRLIPVDKHSFFDFSLTLCRGRGLVKQCALASKPPEFFGHLVQSKSFFKKCMLTVGISYVQLPDSQMQCEGWFEQPYDEMVASHLR